VIINGFTHRRAGDTRAFEAAIRPVIAALSAGLRVHNANWEAGRGRMFLSNVCVPMGGCDVLAGAVLISSLCSFDLKVSFSQIASLPFQLNIGRFELKSGCFALRDGPVEVGRCELECGRFDLNDGPLN
jgi:hypothetical protein